MPDMSGRERDKKRHVARGYVSASFQWTPMLEQYGNTLYAFAKVGDDFNFNTNEEGYSAKMVYG